MHEISQMSGRISGKVLVQGDEEYEEARKVWNGMIDRHPSAIVRCRNEDDVVSAVRFARENGLVTAVRGGGHNVAGFGTCDDGIVIDLSEMKGISVDTASETAEAQGGVTWGEFDEASQRHGLATTGGLVSTTGIAGFTLGGGFGWLVRKYGMTIDNLLAADIVTAEGKKVRTSQQENQELFWGIKGGGGNFGIVTNFHYKLHRVGPEVYGGALFYPLDKAREVVTAYRKWLESVPEEVTSLINFMAAPPADFVPKQFHGHLVLGIALCYAGRKEEGERIVSTLRSLQPALDLVAPVPYANLQKMFDPFFPRGIKSYWKTCYLKGIGDDAVDSMIGEIRKIGSPMSQIHVHHMGGAMARQGRDSGSFAHRNDPFVFNVLALWEDPSMQEREIAWARNVWNEMQKFSTGAPYLNFLSKEGSEQVKAAYGENYPRLVELKKKYDPTNFFRVNQNIPPG